MNILRRLFNTALCPYIIAKEAHKDYEDNKRFGLSFNVENNQLNFINYITNEDKSWVNVFEQQNPCIIVGYVGADDIILGDPANSIIEAYLYRQPELQIN